MKSGTNRQRLQAGAPLVEINRAYAVLGLSCSRAGIVTTTRVLLMSDAIDCWADQSRVRLNLLKESDVSVWSLTSGALHLLRGDDFHLLHLNSESSSAQVLAGRALIGASEHAVDDVPDEPRIK